MIRTGLVLRQRGTFKYALHEAPIACEVDMVGAQIRKPEVKGLAPRAYFYMLNDVLLLKVVRALNA